MAQRNQIEKKEKAAAKNDKEGMAVYQERQVVFQGVIPHPDILKGYEEINADFPERIIQMAENHAKTEDEAQKSLVKGNVVSVILGQILSFLFGITGIGATVFLGMHGNTAGAVVSSVAVIVQAVVSAIVRKKE